MICIGIHDAIVIMSIGIVDTIVIISDIIIRNHN